MMPVRKCPKCGSTNLVYSDGGLKVLYCKNCLTNVDEFGPVYKGGKF